MSKSTAPRNDPSSAPPCCEMSQQTLPTPTSGRVQRRGQTEGANDPGLGISKRPVLNSILVRGSGGAHEWPQLRDSTRERDWYVCLVIWTRLSGSHDPPAECTEQCPQPLLQEGSSRTRKGTVIDQSMWPSRMGELWMMTTAALCWHLDDGSFSIFAHFNRKAPII